MVRVLNLSMRRGSDVLTRPALAQSDMLPIVPCSPCWLPCFELGNRPTRLSNRSFFMPDVRRFPRSRPDAFRPSSLQFSEIEPPSSR